MNDEDTTMTSLDELAEPLDGDGTVAIEPPAAPEPDEPEPQPPEPDPVALALVRLDERLAESQRLIARQAEVADRLHAENQRLRAGELRQAQAALVVSVLRVYDDIARMAETAKVPESRDDLALAADALADALARNGLERIDVESGTAFDARAHKIAAVEETADAASDRTVAGVVRPGFAWADGTVVRVPEVTVRRHTPAPQSA